MYIKLTHDKFSLIIRLDIIASKGFKVNYSFLILSSYLTRKNMLLKVP